MKDYSELRKTAETAAKRGAWFIKPALILELLDEIESLRAMLKEREK